MTMDSLYEALKPFEGGQYLYPINNGREPIVRVEKHENLGIVAIVGPGMNSHGYVPASTQFERLSPTEAKIRKGGYWFGLRMRGETR